MLVATVTQSLPDGRRIQVQHLADAQERERPGTVVAAQPAFRLAEYLPSLRGLGWGFRENGDRVFDNCGHKTLVVSQRNLSLPSEELNRQSAERLQCVSEDDM